MRVCDNCLALHVFGVVLPRHLVSIQGPPPSPTGRCIAAPGSFSIEGIAIAASGSSCGPLEVSAYRALIRRCRPDTEWGQG